MADLSLTLGAIEIGTAVSIFLSGICTLQTWNYYRTFPEDSWGVKALVAFVYIADFTHGALLIQSVFYYTIRSFGNYGALLEPPRTMEASIFCGGAVAFVVQAFYCLRVMRVTKSKLLSLGCFMLTAMRLAFNITIGINLVVKRSFSVLESDLSWLIDSVLATGAASDVAIAGCICYTLVSRRTGFVHTDRILDRLIAYTVGSGLLTSVIAVVELICFLSMKNNYVWMALSMILAKMFSNSLLASLNERNSLRQQMSSIGRQDTSASLVVSQRGAAHPTMSPVSQVILTKNRDDDEPAVELRSLGFVNSSAKEYDTPYHGQTYV